MSRSHRAWYDPRRWPSIIVFMVTMVAMFLLSIVIASIGIRLAGSMEAWQSALNSAGPALLGWRIVLYAVLAGCWLRLWKPRVLASVAKDDDGGEQARHKLRRLEYVGAGFIVVLELISISKWLGGA